MKNTIQISLLGLALASFATACGSTTTGTPDAGTTPAPTLYSLSPGTYCYDVKGVNTVSDGCALGVAALAGSAAYPGTYDSTTGQFTLGTEGSLGTGLLSQNMGTLLRDGNTSDGASCTWHQTDTSNLTMTETNTFSVAVTEQQGTFGSGCGTDIPAGGACTSTWTWTMAINANKVAPGCL